MVKYLKQHEEFIKHALLSKDETFDWQGLKIYHKTQIEFMQHERLIHLLVTLSFAFFLLISIGIALSYPKIEILLLVLLLFTLLIPYVIHYFVLENGVQRWYRLANDIEKRCSKLLN